MSKKIEKYIEKVFTRCFLLRGENYFYKRGLGIKKETLARLVRAFFIVKILP